MSYSEEENIIRWTAWNPNRSDPTAEYSMVMMLYDAETDDTIDQFNVVGRPSSPIFIHEFTPQTMEGMGALANLKLIDVTVYTAGMDRLCVDVRLNGADMATTVAFRNNWDVPGIDVQERSRLVKVPFYKSILVEFNLAFMADRRL
jgi:hypothetical protein